jgi:hypothetical protein
MRSRAWLVLVLLALTSAVHAAQDGERPMPDPSIEAPSLPFCR